MSKQRRTIALDFDGVLHCYNGWNGGKVAGPMPGAKEAVESLVADGQEVVVFSTRDAAMIRQWLREHKFPELEVTSTKRPFYVIVDDRAVAFDGEWSAGLVQRIRKFEPYWIKARNAAVDR